MDSRRIEAAERMLSWELEDRSKQKQQLLVL